MRIVVLLAAVVGVLAFAPVNNEVIEELTRINKTYESYLEYEVKMKVSVVDSTGKKLQSQEMLMARENSCYYTKGGNMEMYGGMQGSFLISTPARRVFYDVYRSYTDSNTYIDKALKSVQMASRTTLTEGDRINRIEFYFDQPIDGMTKIDFSYDRHTKLMESIRLHSYNVSDNPWAPVKGFVSIRYDYAPLSRAIGKKYQYLLKQVQTEEPVLTGDFQGFTLIN